MLKFGGMRNLIPGGFMLSRKPGAAPGTLLELENAHPTEISWFEYSPEAIRESKFADTDQTDDDFRKMLEELRESKQTVWLNVVGLGSIMKIRIIAEVFGIHPLALEDVFELNQRPKVERYPEHLFVLAQMVQGKGAETLEQVSMFIGKNYVITMQQKPGDVFDSLRERIKVGKGRIRKGGPDYLLYALLDSIVDNYFLLIDTIDQHIEIIEDAILLRIEQRQFTEIHKLRGHVRVIRRLFRPQHLMIEELTRVKEGEDPYVDHDTQVFLRDCHDHAMQIYDNLERLQDQVTDLMDLYHTILSNRMNEIMKVLTLVAAIFIPLTFIAGIYGMNFDTSYKWNMPELSFAYGYPTALLSMVVIALLLVYYFWKKKWL